MLVHCSILVYCTLWKPSCLYWSIRPSPRLPHRQGLFFLIVSPDCSIEGRPGPSLADRRPPFCYPFLEQACHRQVDRWSDSRDGPCGRGGGLRTHCEDPKGFKEQRQVPTCSPAQNVDSLRAEQLQRLRAMGQGGAVTVQKSPEVGGL